MSRLPRPEVVLTISGSGCAAPWAVPEGVGCGAKARPSARIPRWGVGRVYRRGVDNPFGPYDENAPVLGDPRLRVLSSVWADSGTPDSLREKMIVAATREEMIVPVLRMVWDEPAVHVWFRRQALVAAMDGDPFSDDPGLLPGSTISFDWMCENYTAVIEFLRRNEKRYRYNNLNVLCSDDVWRLFPVLAERFDTMPSVEWLDDLVRFIITPRTYINGPPWKSGRDPARAIALMEVTAPREVRANEGWVTIGPDFALASPWVLDKADLENPDVGRSLLAISRLKCQGGDVELEQRIRDRAKAIKSDGAIISIAARAHGGDVAASVF